MSERDNQMADMLNRIHQQSKQDDRRYLKQSEQSSSNSSSADDKPSQVASSVSSTSNTSTQASNHDDGNKSTHMISWSVMLDYRTIAIINALEKLYNCKNRDEVIHMLFHHNLKHLINAKGVSGREHFELYRKVYLLTTKGKAIKRYRKFYQK